MKLEFRRSLTFSALVLLALTQGLVARTAAAANTVCGYGNVQTLAIGNDLPASGTARLWLEISVEHFNGQEDAAQYPRANIIRLTRTDDADLFQRQMLVLVTAFARGVPIRILSEKLATPKCDASADEYQLTTGDDPNCAAIDSP